MDAEDSWRVITAERLSLADLLEGLSAEQWETPSLCAGWRVRDIAAHLTLGASPLNWPDRLAWGLRARGNFDRLNHDVAVAHAARDTALIVADLREHAASRKLPVPLVTSHRTTMVDVLVHGQDIAVPLGASRDMPVTAAVAAAITVWQRGWPFWARRRLRGVRLRATDAPCEFGTGSLVEGSIIAILLLLTGRPEALRALTGPGVAGLGK